ncbi:FliH/SctL family protein [Granulosicoccus antarcticus]|uniref:Flagellar assembly protein FliH n=1 Tax=Granulosicoccus antarcticus IMCC3135 TaxID=1192854 RepID=A0A2Z2NTR0_9GAMM|nr:FliH/SctL family protein [Granulosicoccus antarcticus]ASJ70504.1 hypothetical protein IMCC3135_01950 [Granulosicoccus antarcticus IMCC3135]
MTFISLFSDERGFLITDQRVFAADELQPLLSVTEQAQQFCQRLAAQATQEEQARINAIERGREEGLAIAQEQARLELAETLRLLHEEYQRQLLAVQASAAILAVDIVRKVAGQVNSTEWLLAQAQRAVEDIVDQPSVTLRVHSSQAAALKERLEVLALSGINQVIADDMLPENGCVLETAQGQIDIDLETQLNSVLALFVDDTGAELPGARNSHG